jgi:hypothetical protein
MHGKGKKFRRLKMTAAAGCASLALWIGIAAWTHGEVSGSGGLDAPEDSGLADIAAGFGNGTEHAAEGADAAEGDGERAAQDGDVPLPEEAGVLKAVRGSAKLSESVDVSLLDGARLAAGKLFSLRDRIGDEPGEGWDYPASLLHEAAVKTGFGVVERHVGLTLAEGASPGFEARVSGTSRDLLLYNGLGFDVWIEAGADGEGIPEIRLVGSPPEHWQAPGIVAAAEWFPPGIIALSDGGPEADYKPSWTGRDGLLAKVYRLEGGERVLLYKDFYPPLPIVELDR